MTTPAFAPEEIQTAEHTRSARLKWVVVVDDSTPIGPLVNAVACIAASTGASIDGLIATPATDATGSEHPGLPWTGCSILSAGPAELAEIRARAAANDAMFIADMPRIAQSNSVYDEYVAELSTIEPEVIGISVVGPRNAVARLVKRLPLLS